MKTIKISLALVALCMYGIFTASAAFASVNDDQVTSQKIREADGTSGQNTNSGSGVKTGHMQDGAITTSKIVDGAVTTNKVTDGSVTTSKISDGAVTDVKITGPISRSKLEKYGKVAVVAQTGGDYTNPVAAMTNIASWCGAPSATNPCLLKIMPGVYEIDKRAFQMRSFIDLEGSGREVTKLIAHSPDMDSVGVINYVNVDHSELRNITIENESSYSIAYNWGIYVQGGAPRFTDIDVNVLHGSQNLGFFITSGAKPILQNVKIHGEGLDRRQPVMDSGVGIHAEQGSELFLDGVDIYHMKSNYFQGIKLVDSPTVMKNINISSSDIYGDFVGIEVASNDAVPDLIKIYSSNIFKPTGISSLTASIRIWNSNVTVKGADLQLDGEIKNVGGGIYKCIYCYDINFDPIP